MLEHTSVLDLEGIGWSGEEGRFDVAARSETPNHLPKRQTATVATAQRPK